MGASGLVGQALCSELQASGHQWTGFSRNPTGRSGQWRHLSEGFAGLSALVNLAGDPIDKRWTDENKIRFHQSRVGVTQDIVALLKKSAPESRPQTFLNASAVGFYGSQEDNLLTEDSPAGQDYLATLCHEWEAAAEKAESLGVRVLYGRIGVVLGSQASSWKRMKLIFSLGAGGRLGSGQQYWPIVHLEDVVGGIIHALESPAIRGPVNLVGPTTVTNADFTRALGATLNRPTLIPTPGFALKLVLGGFSEALLASYRVSPTVLAKTGYQFRHRELGALLESLN